MNEKQPWGAYEFNRCNPNFQWNDVGGIYIFTGLNAAKNAWIAYYIGQTDSFSNRLPSHERWDEAVRKGATEIHARVEKDARKRDSMEAELIQRFQPPLNTQLK